MSTAEVDALARQIADAAALATLAGELAEMPCGGGWRSTLLPYDTAPDTVSAVRRALRYLHLRGLIADHPLRPWVRPVAADVGARPKRGRPAGRVAAR